MKLRHSCARISIVVAMVWAIVLIPGAIIDRHVTFSGTTLEVLLMVFAGSAIGWVGGTIARARGGSTTSSCSTPLAPFVVPWYLAPIDERGLIATS
ncbi:MAG: hypothetical protein ACLP62_11530 [Acidimicrobiales bacterium]